VNREVLSWDDGVEVNTYSQELQCPESEVVGNYTLIRDTDDPDTIVQVKNSAYARFIAGEYSRLNS